MGSDPRRQPERSSPARGSRPRDDGPAPPPGAPRRSGTCRCARIPPSASSMCTQRTMPSRSIRTARYPCGNCCSDLARVALGRELEAILVVLEHGHAPRRSPAAAVAPPSRRSSRSAERVQAAPWRHRKLRRPRRRDGSIRSGSTASGTRVGSVPEVEPGTLEVARHHRERLDPGRPQLVPETVRASRSAADRTGSRSPGRRPAAARSVPGSRRVRPSRPDPRPDSVKSGAGSPGRATRAMSVISTWSRWLTVSSDYACQA